MRTNGIFQPPYTLWHICRCSAKSSSQNLILMMLPTSFGLCIYKVSLTVQRCVCISQNWSLTYLMRPLSATTAASSSVSKQPRKRQVLGWPACSAGIMRWTAHLLSKTDHETPVNLKGRWQACQVLRNRTHGQITCSINTRYKMHAVQNAWGTKCMRYKMHAVQNYMGPCCWHGQKICLLLLHTILGSYSKLT